MDNPTNTEISTNISDTPLTPDSPLNRPNFSTPPFRYYFVVSFFLALFVLVLDGIYRSDAFLTRLDLFQFLRNALFFWILLFVLLILISCLLWGIDFLTMLVLKKKSQGNDSGDSGYSNQISGAIFYLLFLYINLVYLRLYLLAFVPKMRSSEYLTWMAVGVSAAGIIIYALLSGRITRSKKYPVLLNSLYKITAPLTILMIISGIGIFLYNTGKQAQLSRENIRKSGGKPHIVFITLDNVRIHNMSLYGYYRPTTPFLKEFADESYVFRNMMTNSTETITTMPAIVTGRYSSKKFPNNASFFEKSLPSVLQKNGYEKVCFLSPLSMNMFPQKIFNEYLILNNAKSNPVRRFAALGYKRRNMLWLSYFLSEDRHFYNIFSEKDPRDMSERQTFTIMDEGYNYIVNTLKENEKPVFIWAHFLETHPPYEPPPIFKEQLEGSNDPEKDKYNACIRYCDYKLRNFVARLKAEGLYDRTLIVISSDHGCYFGKESLIYRTMQGPPPQSTCPRFSNFFVNVPLIIHEPGQKKGKWVKSIAHHTDIAPTILDIAGIEVPPEMDGESLVQYMRGDKKVSDRVKIGIPAQYFYRWNNMAFDDVSQFQFEQFNAYYDHYVVELIQQQYVKKKENGKIVHIETKQLPYTCIGVYDLDKDIYRIKDLKNDPGMNMVINKVTDSKWIKYYGTTDKN